MSAELVRRAIQKLEALQRAGVTQVPKPRRRPATVKALGLATAAAEPSTSMAATPAEDASALKGMPPAAAPPGTPVPKVSADPTSALQVLQERVAGCTRCAELAATRSQTVFGVGNPRSRLVFLGEAPGADEDLQGEPFVGRAGQLLTKIIEACTLSRAEVYILNVLKCRPPGNRNPLPDEVENCREYLNQQLEIIRPQFICCLGAVAAKALLNTETSIGRLRGRFHEYRGAEVLCTYHPAYLLRNPAAKKDVWEDMKLLMGRMGIVI